MPKPSDLPTNLIAASPFLTNTLLGLGIGLSALPASAASVAIVNPSFETDDVSGLTNQLNADIVPTGWAAYDDGRNAATGGNARGLVYHGPGTSVVGATLGQNDGSQSFFTAQRDIFQTLGTNLAADTIYTLTVAIGDRDVANAGGNVGDNIINLGTGATGGLNILASLDSSSPGATATVNGDWVDWAVTFTTNATTPGIGQPLRIELTTDTNVGWFDNVRLDAEPIPEPSSVLLLGLSGLALLRRNRK